MQTHVKVVAVLLIVFSALGVMLALGMGAIFSFAGMASAGSDGAEIALPILGMTGTLVTIFFLAVSLPGLIAGFGLLSFKPWARILGIVICAINLINIPFGTIFGIYGLWVLLNKDTERLFSPGPVTSV